MKISPRLYKISALVLVAGGIAFGVNKMSRSASTNSQVEVKMPVLSAEAKIGEQLYNDNCAACHGERGAGTNQGPTFMHRVYHPGHHADGAFILAVQRGSRAHHWKFGNMPPQPQVSLEEVKAITLYVRELQKANGIF